MSFETKTKEKKDLNVEAEARRCWGPSSALWFMLEDNFGENSCKRRVNELWIRFGLEILWLEKFLCAIWIFYEKYFARLSSWCWKWESSWRFCVWSVVSGVMMEQVSVMMICWPENYDLIRKSRRKLHKRAEFCVTLNWINLVIYMQAKHHSVRCFYAFEWLLMISTKESQILPLTDKNLNQT